MKKDKHIATNLLILINILVFVYMVYKFKLNILNMYNNFSNIDLFRSGALFAPAIIYNRQYWRLLTAMFMHVNLMHIAVNMAFLYFLGVQVEKYYGFWKTILIYLISGFTGNIWGCLLVKNSISAGASTAIFGFFGAFVALNLMYKNDAYIYQMSKEFLLLVAFNLIFDIFMRGINIWAHIGGLIGGLLIGIILGSHSLKNAVSKRIFAIIGIILINLIIIYLSMLSF